MGSVLLAVTMLTGIEAAGADYSNACSRKLQEIRRERTSETVSTKHI